MATELRVPQVGESVSEVQIGDWSHQEGDLVKQDEALVAIETDKVTLEVTAPASGRLVRIILTKGMSARVGDVVGLFEREADAAVPVGSAGSAATSAAREVRSSETRAAAPETHHAAAASVAGPGAVIEEPVPWASPAARRRLAERGLHEQALTGQVAADSAMRGAVQPRQAGGSSVPRRQAADTGRLGAEAAAPVGEFEEVVKMSPLRQRVAERLLESQHSMALLTTFNEIDMSAVQQLRSEARSEFFEKHGVKLGLMSFFVRASLEALKSFPVVNAEVRGTDIIYKNHYDIGIAVGGGRGLVVPVLRNVERLGFAAIERSIAEYAARAKENKLELRDLTGGTFTITNGGVYGSMLSTPIVNPPQSAILGLHAINDRPVARSGQVVIRPMMYVALTYDHRIVDGREAVSFLRRVKDLVENPIRLLLEI